MNFTSRFKARDRKNDYLNSRDDKNDAFFVIYFVIRVVGVITPTLITVLSCGVMLQGNLYTGGRLLYGLCSCQSTLELTVDILGDIWLTTAHVVPSPSPFIEISLVGANKKCRQI